MTAPQATDLGAWLDRLEATWKAATKGPWAKFWGNRIGAGVQVHDAGGVSVENYIGEIADEDDRADYDNSPNLASPSADAAAIVAEHNATPALIAAVRGVLAKCDALEAAAPIGRFFAEEFRGVVTAALGETGGER